MIIVSLVIVDTSLGVMVDKIVVTVLIWVVPHNVTGGRSSHILTRGRVGGLLCEWYD